MFYISVFFSDTMMNKRRRAPREDEKIMSKKETPLRIGAKKNQMIIYFLLVFICHASSPQSVLCPFCPECIYIYCLFSKKEFVVHILAVGRSCSLIMTVSLLYVLSGAQNERLYNFQSLKYERTNERTNRFVVRCHLYLR